MRLSNESRQRLNVAPSRRPPIARECLLTGEEPTTISSDEKTVRDPLKTLAELIGLGAVADLHPAIKCCTMFDPAPSVVLIRRGGLDEAA